MSLQLQFGEQLLDAEFVVCGHRFQDAAEQGSCFERAIIRDRDMVRSLHRGREADVRAVLPDRFVTKDSQCANEV